MILIKNGNNVIIALRDNIIIYDTANQNDYHIKVPEIVLQEKLTKGQTQSLEVNNITSIDCSKLGNYVVATESKQVVVYDKDFHVIKNYMVNRIPSKVCFTPSNDILVADKTGDVYLYKSDSKDQPSLLLGHHSVILDVVISDCGKYVITCDRDEKIRVSCFPNCYNIISFCLGHKEFVTKLVLANNVLLSASGDGTIRFWNFIKGEQLGLINTNEYIDSNLLKTFVEEMDKEKVDITALPISDMQTYKGNKLYIAVAIYKFDSIQLYTTDLTSFKSNYISKVNVNHPFTFLLNTDLYILSNRLLIFKLMNNNFTQIDDSYVDKFYDKYKHILNVDSDSLDIMKLYKRKYDNMKQYLERKRQRLEAK